MAQFTANSCLYKHTKRRLCLEAILEAAQQEDGKKALFAQFNLRTLLGRGREKEAGNGLQLMTTKIEFQNKVNLFLSQLVALKLVTSIAYSILFLLLQYKFMNVTSKKKCNFLVLLIKATARTYSPFWLFWPSLEPHGRLILHLN